MIRFTLVLLMSLAVSSQAVAAVKWNNSSSNNSDKSSNPILQPDLGIPQDGKDTTLFGFKQKDGERFKYYGEKELLKYEKERNIKLFSIVNDNTRFGDTAFFVQAPADGCYNRWTQDCEREHALRNNTHHLLYAGVEHDFCTSFCASPFICKHMKCLHINEISV